MFHAVQSVERTSLLFRAAIRRRIFFVRAATVARLLGIIFCPTVRVLRTVFATLAKKISTALVSISLSAFSCIAAFFFVVASKPPKNPGFFVFFLIFEAQIRTCILQNLLKSFRRIWPSQVFQLIDVVKIVPRIHILFFFFEIDIAFLEITFF